MVCIEGLADHQVVQRADPSGAVVALRGHSAGDVSLRAVSLSGQVVTEWCAVGSGAWKADLSLPVGGPYDVVACEGGADPAVVARSVLVGDLWVMAGQSNMQGCGRLDADVEDPSTSVNVLDMSRRWRPAVDPLHHIYSSPDMAHHEIADAEQRAAAAEAAFRHPFGAGLGVAFGKAVFAATGVPVGLIATAQGGSTTARWAPDLRGEADQSLFGSMLLSTKAAGGRVAGVLWYQGESDALEGTAEGFGDRLTAIVAAMREEFGVDVPFLHVQIGRLIRPAPADMVESIDHQWSSVRESQRRADVGPGGLTTAVDLGLHDGVHLSTASLRRVGRRLAALATGDNSTIELVAVDCAATASLAPDGTPAFRIRVQLEGAHGALSPLEHIAGFSIRGPHGELRRLHLSADVDPDAPGVVVVRGMGRIEPGDALWYGYGVDPYCNLVDGHDMAVPAFGPWLLPDLDQGS